MASDENISSTFKSFRFSSLDENNSYSNITSSNAEPIDNITSPESSNEEPVTEELVEKVISKSSNNEEESVVEEQIEDSSSKIEKINTIINNPSKSFLIIVFNIERINKISNHLVVFNYIYDTVYLHESDCNQHKWTSVLNYFNQNESWKQYKYIWIPDCNINISDNHIINFLQTTERLNQDVTQPSLIKSTDSSIYTHKSLLKQTNLENRKAFFIENKMPCFKVEFVEDSLIPFLSSNSKFITSGWGIDLWWSSVSKNMSIIDSIEVEDNSSYIDKSIGSKELKYFLKKYKLKLSIMSKC